MISRINLVSVLIISILFNFFLVFDIGAEDTAITSDTGVIHLGKEPGNFNDIKVGIGTKKPKAELHVRGKLLVDKHEQGNVTLGKINDTNLGLRIVPSSKATEKHIILKYGQVSYDGDALRIYTGDIRPIPGQINLGLTLLNNGNVGIGNLKPDAKLVVEGNVKISGNLDVSNLIIRNNRNIISYYTIPACDFIGTPMNLIGGTSYNEFDDVNNKDPMASLVIYAGLKLPHGAEIKKVQCYWTDSVDQNGRCFLKRSKLDNGDKENLAVLESRFNESNRRMNFTDQIEHPIIDNQNYVYGFQVIIPPNGLHFKFHAVKVHYIN